MSRNDYVFSPKYPQTGGLRYDLPRYTIGEYGTPVMEPLRTEDLPEPPPRRPGSLDTRFVVTLVGVALLFFITLTAATFILKRSDANVDIADETSAPMRQRTIMFHKVTMNPISVTSDAPTLDLNTTFIATDAMNETWSVDERR